MRHTSNYTSISIWAQRWVEMCLHFMIMLGLMSDKLREIRRTPDDKRWRLALLQGQDHISQDFDKVILSTGNTHTAHIPQIDGRELFKGKVLHSQAFKR